MGAGPEVGLACFRAFPFTRGAAFAELSLLGLIYPNFSHDWGPKSCLILISNIAPDEVPHRGSRNIHTLHCCLAWIRNSSHSQQATQKISKYRFCTVCRFFPGMPVTLLWSFSIRNISSTTDGNVRKMLLLERGVGEIFMRYPFARAIKRSRRGYLHP